MAVEIPVVVDIEGAFKDAAKRVKTAMKPLQDVIDSAPASLFIEVKIGKSKKLLIELFDDAHTSVETFQKALDQVNAKIDKLAAKGGFNLRGKGLTAEEKSLIDASQLLETQLKGVGNASDAMGRILTMNMKRAEEEIVKYTAQLDKLQRKQNKSRRMTADKSGLTAGLPYEKQITAVNAELQQTRSFIAACSIEMDKLAGKTTKLAASMGTVKTYSQRVADEFRQGHEAISRWNAALGTSQSRLGALIKSSVTLVALHGATRFLKNVRNVTAEFEMQRVALGGIIQDTERAESLFKQIKAAAIQSPFEIKDLVSFTKQLSAYRIETEQLFDVTMRLADISAGLGVDMSRLVLAYGQVRAAAVLRGQELRQFTEAGIPLVELLAQKFTELNGRTVKTAEVFELISKRAVPFSMIKEIFEDMTNAGGIFYKMQEKQSETLKGQWMKLKDAASIMYDEIGNTGVVHKAMTDLLATSMKLMRNWKQVGSVLGIAVASLVAYKIALKNAAISVNALTLREAASISSFELATKAQLKQIAATKTGTMAHKRAIWIANQYVRAKKRETVATNMFTKAYYRMIAAFLKNPYAIAIAGITALIAVIVKLVRKSREAKITNEEFQKSIETFDRANTRARDIDALCDKYDELSKKTSKTKEETDKLARTSKELARLYPQAITGIDKETNSLNVNTEAIRKNNEQAREAIRLSLQKELNRAKKELKKYTDERDQILERLESGQEVRHLGKGRYELIPMTEETKAKLGEQLTDVNNRIIELNKSVGDAEDNLNGLKDDLIGPMPPDFFGDAWRMQLNQYKTTLKSTSTEIKALTKDQIEGFSDQRAALDAVAKEYKSQTELVNFYTNALKTATGERKKQTENSLADAKAVQTMYGQILTDFNAWDLVKDKSKKSGDTVSKQISDITNAYKKYVELLKYKNKAGALADIDVLFPSLKGWQPTYENMISKLEGMLNNYRGDADATRLIQQAIANIKFDKLKSDMDDMLKRLSNELKRSETARNFYNEILGLTGDQQLATNLSVSIYGDVGSEFRDRIQKQMDDAFKTLDWGALDKKTGGILLAAYRTQDFDTILKNIDQFPEKIRERLKEIITDTEKFNADLAKELVKSLADAKTYSDKRIDIANQTAKRLADIDSLNISEKAKEQMREQNTRKEAEEVAKLEYEAFKETPMYVELFANLDRASTDMLRNMRDRLLELKGQWGDSLPPTELKEMQSRLKEIDQQLATKNPFKALIDSIKEYRAMTSQMSRGEADSRATSATAYADMQKELLVIAKENYDAVVAKEGASSEAARQAEDELNAQKDTTDEAIEQANAAQETANAYRSAAQHISDAAKGLETWAGYVSDALGGIEKIVDTFASNEVSETFSIIAGGINNTLGGAAKLAAGIAMGPMGIPTIIAGLGDLIKGIFGTANELRIKRANNQIKTQTRLIEDLEESYEKLNKAMDKSFGDEYVYNLNKMLETLEAEYEAYRKQADAERSKGKKTDEDALRGYEKSARDTLEKMKELRQEASSFFAGSDLASAAESFADAWLSAYEEFGDTAGAIEERMTEMVQNIVKKAALSGIAQAVMADWYSSLADIQDWNAKTVAEKWREAMALVDPMVQGMNNFASAMQAEGVSLRNTTGQFSGIARNIAGATEESITGLAAGVNTQNFYISHIDASVSAILAIMSGGAQGSSEVPAGVSSTDLMIQYMSTLPSIDQNLAELLRKVSSVISPKSAATNTHYIAVK